MRADELAEFRGRLEDFAGEVFAPLVRADQRVKGGLYLRGLLLDGRRKSMQPMAERLGVDHQQLQQFMTSSTWPVDTVRTRPARNKVNVKKVLTAWPDMLRVAGSLVTNQVRAYDLLRMFGREGHPTPLGQAFAEYGRIAKTLHLLAVVDPVDDTYRRQMHKQLTVQESRHKLARDICHGKKGTIHQAYRDGMEDQLGSLGLVLNAVVLWTARYIDAAVAQLRAEGHEIRDEDMARLSPLKHRNLNVLGRCSFTATQPTGGTLRPLRDPDAAGLDDDEDSAEN